MASFSTKIKLNEANQTRPLGIDPTEGIRKKGAH
jgi:hypothetical protein